MNHDLQLDDDQMARRPLILNVPGLNNSGPAHWQSLWEQQCSDFRRAELGMWDNPHRNTWVNQLNLAIHRAARPTILVAHSLGCLAVAWWAALEQPDYGNPVIGALLVAPPDVDREGIDARLARFSSCPRENLPFPSILVASENDPFCSIDAARQLADDWGAGFENVGRLGHLNADSGLGDWQAGKELLARLVERRAGASGRRMGIGRNSSYDPNNRVVPFRRAGTPLSYPLGSTGDP
ncbi:RBBP9/YdeN family alpha/beta hydrolase [Tsuneonella sp. HG222]